MNSRIRNYATLYSYFSSLFSINVTDYITKRKPLKLPRIPIPVLSQLLEDASDIFRNEPIVLRVTSPLVVVGDLHGQILDLFRILKKVVVISQNSEKVTTKIVFLGDFVDRGQFSLETIVLVLTMKILWPNMISIVRGNHEFQEIFHSGGFAEELNNTYGREQQVESMFQSCFSNMPLACIIDEFAICLHAGVGPAVTSIDSISAIERPISTFAADIVADLLWSDPSEYVQNFHPSSRGSGSLFGVFPLASFLDSMKLNILIRGHQCVDSGVYSIWDDRCYTVFSASNYCGISNNKSGILLINGNNLVDQITFDPISIFKREEAQFIESKGQTVLIYPDVKLPTLSLLTPKPRAAVKKRARTNSLQLKVSLSLMQKSDLKIPVPVAAMTPSKMKRTSTELLTVTPTTERSKPRTKMLI